MGALGDEAIISWCNALPGVGRSSDRLWELAGEFSVSYPDEAHSVLARIEERSYWFQQRNRIISAVVSNFPPPGPIVDIGGGNGFVSAALADAGFPAVVIEPGRGGVKVALERGLSVVCAPFQDLGIPAGSMPAAAMFDVLEHIEDDAAALANVHQALVPGGRLYLTVPAFGWLWSDEDVHAGHFRRYTLDMLRQRMKAAGFDVEYATCFFSALVAPLFVFRTAASKVGLRKANSANQTRQEHSLPAGWVGRMMERSFASELRKVSARETVAYGTSCLIVVRKPG